eukprot:9695019-Alexandrium_andersonii.AAC.1
MRVKALSSNVPGVFGDDADDMVARAQQMVASGAGVGSDGVFSGAFENGHISDMRDLLPPADDTS